jgi:large subunit ribosomal protein L23
MTPDQIIIEPLLSEKTNHLREAHKYSFRVHKAANKIEITKAVRTLFGVHPVSCNVMNVRGKPRRVRYRIGRTASWRKAIITLRSDESIGIFEGA